MKTRGKSTILLLAGMLVGLILAPTAANAVSQYLTATPSTQTFFLGDQQIQLEAYAINGHNYVKLRDVGRAVDFNVCYDAGRNAAIMEPDKPYTGEDATAVPSPSPQPAGSTDYAAQANPDIFTGELTRDAYNGIRGTLLNRDNILSGAVTPSTFEAKLSSSSQLNNAVSMLGQYPRYQLNAVAPGQYRCDVKCLDVYATAVEHTQSFVDGISGMSQEKQAEEIAWYVCDRLTYAIEYPFVDEVLSQDGQVKGCCMAYSYCFQFLCDRAGIPCILTASETHQWNQVFIGGKWWVVDATGLDLGDEVDIRPSLTVLNDPSQVYGNIFADSDPQSTAFTKELLAPGSTK